MTNEGLVRDLTYPVGHCEPRQASSSTKRTHQIRVTFAAAMSDEMENGSEGGTRTRNLLPQESFGYLLKYVQTWRHNIPNTTDEMPHPTRIAPNVLAFVGRDVATSLTCIFAKSMAKATPGGSGKGETEGYLACSLPIVWKLYGCIKTAAWGLGA
jgi:hypothetical protein